MLIKLTQSVCHTFLPPGLPDSKGAILLDRNGSGLGVKILPIRSKKPGAIRRRYWVFRYTTKNPLGTVNPRPATRHEFTIGSLGRFPSLEWARRETIKLNALVADGHNPVEMRRQGKVQALQAKTVADLDLTVHFKTSWEKPTSCRAAGESKSATRQRSCWTTHILPRIGKLLVADVKVGHIDEILTSVLRSHGQNTAAAVRGVLHAALNRAEKWDLIPEGVTWTNPVKASVVIPTKKRRDVIMTRKQYHDAVDAAEDLLDEIDVTSRYGLSHTRQVLAFLVAAETGRRPGEIYSLQQQFINYEEGTAYLPSTKANRHDAAKHQGQIFGLSERAMTFLWRAQELAGTSQFTFPANTLSGHIEKARWAWNRIREKANIPEDVVMYTTRHRWVSEAGRAGADLKTASTQLGHHGLDMTAHYLVCDASDLATFAESVSASLARDREMQATT